MVAINALHDFMLLNIFSKVNFRETKILLSEKGNFAGSTRLLLLLIFVKILSKDAVYLVQKYNLKKSHNKFLSALLYIEVSTDHNVTDVEFHYNIKKLAHNVMENFKLSTR